jgi:hypothetical protein
VFALMGMRIHSAMAAPEQAQGFVELFNGKDLDGWEGDPELWSVQDGAIVGKTNAEKPLKHNSFLMWKKGTVRDFELHASFKITNGNSGIQYRSKDEGDHIASGYQADMDGAATDKYTGILYEERGRGILAERGQKVVIDEAGKKQVAGSVGDASEILKGIKKGEWNDYVITAQGNHIVQKINGVTTIDVTDNQAAKAAREGILALQLHMGPPMMVQFKDIKLKVMKEQ